MRALLEGVVLLGLSLFAILGVWSVPAAANNETWAGIVPFGAGLGLMIVSSIMIFSSLPRQTAGTATPSADHSSTLSIFALFAIALLYQHSIRWFGYVLPTAMVAPVVLYMFGVRSWSGLAVSVVLCPLVYHVIFFVLLGVFPPFGEIFDLLDLFEG